MHISPKRLLLTTGAVVAVALLAMLWSCGGRDRDADAEATPWVTIRSYQVAPETGPELKSVINSVLSRGENLPRAGRAELGPNGLLVVAAPGDTLNQIGRIIADVASVDTESPPAVTITYWLVVGTPASATSRSPRLEGLGKVLDTVASADGPTAFSLLEKMTMTSISGTRAQGSGQFLRIHTQRAAVQDGNVIADLDLRAAFGSDGTVQTRVAIPTGKFLVLSQMGFNTSPSRKEPPQTLYFLVRAEVGVGAESPA